jgi:hypothetical protein
MNELNQSDDCYIPAFLLSMHAQPEVSVHYTQAEDFLMNIKGWTADIPQEDVE